jgi:hypothetical protein
VNEFPVCKFHKLKGKKESLTILNQFLHDDMEPLNLNELLK